MNDSETKPSGVSTSLVDDAAQGPPGDRANDLCCKTETKPQRAQKPKELGGRDGLDPTRYGDWEKKGRCVDF